MFPEVPLALRTSSHLLVGVVRIYSKKVDYLYNDWNLLNTWVAKAFVSTQVNLPEDARQAPPESVTLPQALNLDEFDLEDDTLDMYSSFLLLFEFLSVLKPDSSLTFFSCEF